MKTNEDNVNEQFLSEKLSCPENNLKKIKVSFLNSNEGVAWIHKWIVNVLKYNINVIYTMQKNLCAKK